MDSSSGTFTCEMYIFEEKDYRIDYLLFKYNEKWSLVVNHEGERGGIIDIMFSTSVQ